MTRKRLCKLCSRPAVAYGLCDQHQKHKPPTPERTDNATWRTRQAQKFRAEYLANHPYCMDCMERGQPVPATEVHHMRSQIERPDLVLDASNCLALCHACHLARHGRGGG